MDIEYNIFLYWLILVKVVVGIERALTEIDLSSKTHLTL